MQNMSRYSKIIYLAAASLAAASCAHVAKIDGTIEQAPSSEIIVKALDINKYTVLDTVAVDASGRFSYDVEIEEGQPEFVYLYRGDKKIASLLLSEGDRVEVKADTLGNYTVSGSEESLKLAEVEKSFEAVSARLNTLTAKIQTASSSEEEASLKKQILDEYIAYYRDRVIYIMSNSRSLTVVPVLYQVLGENLPVFGQVTDAIHFMNISDSLSAVYPSSKYVKALKKEAQTRQAYLKFDTQVGQAEEVGFPDITLTDINGKKSTLSDLDSKVIMVQFWTATDAAQKMFNIDVLKPLYEDFHSKGFEIYQVALDPEKVVWANVVKEQNLPWISVCDSRGASSPYTMLYNVGSLPATFIIADGELVDGDVVDEKSLRRELAKLLK